MPSLNDHKGKFGGNVYTWKNLPYNLFRSYSYSRPFGVGKEGYIEKNNIKMIGENYKENTSLTNYIFIMKWFNGNCNGSLFILLFFVVAKEKRQSIK